MGMEHLGPKSFFFTSVTQFWPMRRDHFCFWAHHNISFRFRVAAIWARVSVFFWKPSPNVRLCLRWTALACTARGLDKYIPLTIFKVRQMIFNLNFFLCPYFWCKVPKGKNMIFQDVWWKAPGLIGIQIINNWLTNRILITDQSQMIYL